LNRPQLKSRASLFVFTVTDCVRPHGTAGRIECDMYNFDVNVCWVVSVQLTKARLTMCAGGNGPVLGAARLVDPDVNLDDGWAFGRPQVSSNGTYYDVCRFIRKLSGINRPSGRKELFGDPDATVACREQSFGLGGVVAESFVNRVWNDQPSPSNDYEAVRWVEPQLNALFKCRGDEDALAECDFLTFAENKIADYAAYDYESPPPVLAIPANGPTTSAQRVTGPPLEGLTLVAPAPGPALLPGAGSVGTDVVSGARRQASTTLSLLPISRRCRSRALKTTLCKTWRA
jgi:hypothetical protein